MKRPIDFSALSCPMHVSALACLLLNMSAAGCGSPIVGAECREGFTRCGHECVDFSSDRDHCGACGNECEVGQSCFSSMCSATRDGSFPDGGFDDGGPDDASRDVEGIDAPQDGDLGDGSTDGSIDGSVDGATDGAVDGSADGGPRLCPCDLGELCCDDLCARPESDPLNCGGCGVECGAGEVCADNTCSLVCDPPLERCGPLCVDTMGSDPDNCGGCGVRCDTGICIDGACSAGIPGHVVLIGHSYRTSRVSMRTVAGNAVFIPLGASLDVLVYEGDSPNSAIRGVDQAIDEAASMRGRTWTRIPAPDPAAVPTMLEDVDVFVVYSQIRSEDTVLQMLGTDWAPALMTYLLRGGVVVVFDAGGMHSGTWQVVDSAGLIPVSGRNNITDSNVEIVAPADSVAIGVPTRYRAERESVSFEAPDMDVVIEHMASGAPVVIHRVFTP